MKRPYLAFLLLAFAVPVCSVAQTKVIYPGSNVSTSSECERNPSAANCIERKAASATDRIRTSEDPSQPIGPGPNRPQPLVEDPPTEFQEFVASGTGQTLPIFGGSLFSQVPSTFA